MVLPGAIYLELYGFVDVKLVAHFPTRLLSTIFGFSSKCSRSSKTFVTEHKQIPVATVLNSHCLNCWNNNPRSKCRSTRIRLQFFSRRLLDSVYFFLFPSINSRCNLLKKSGCKIQESTAPHIIRSYRWKENLLQRPPPSRILEQNSHRWFLIPQVQTYSCLLCIGQP